MPEIATSWDVSPDGTKYTFHLRHSTWSDGRPLTARDFAESWQRVLDPATGAKYSSMLYVIKNAEPVNLRALIVTGLDSFPAKLLKEVQAIAPIARVLPSDSPRGFFIYADGNDKNASRNALLQYFKTQPNVEARIADTDILGVKVVDDYTLSVKLEGPIPYFLHLTNIYPFYPVPIHLLKQLKEQEIRPELWTRPQHIVTNGPYVLTEWKFRRYVPF